MCRERWIAAGSPMIDSLIIRQAVPLIRDVQVSSAQCGSAKFGNLQLLLHYGCIYDCDVQYCHGKISRNIRQLAAERRCLDALDVMTVEERLSAIGLYHGHWRLNNEG